MNLPKPVACDELDYPPDGPFSRDSIRAMTDDRVRKLLTPRAQLTWLVRRRVECEAVRRGLIEDPAREEVPA